MEWINFLKGTNYWRSFKKKYITLKALYLLEKNNLFKTYPTKNIPRHRWLHWWTVPNVRDTNNNTTQICAKYWRTNHSVTQAFKLPWYPNQKRTKNSTGKTKRSHKHKGKKSFSQYLHLEPSDILKELWSKKVYSKACKTYLTFKNQYSLHIN